MSTKNRRPEVGPGTAQEAIEEAKASLTHPADTWATTYRAALLWVAWTARRRWPHHPANDLIWAASVASWWHGGRHG